MLTKKHFEKTAEIIRTLPTQEQRLNMARKFAQDFRKSNPRFDEVRFFVACNAY